MVPIYDCMTWLIRRILNNTDEEFYEKYGAATVEQQKSINLVLAEKFPEIITENGNPRVISPSRCNISNLIHKIQEFTQSCIQEKDIMPLARLLTKLDMSLSYRFENYVTDFGEISGINENYEEQQIQLLPRCYSGWAHGKKEQISSSHLNNLLNHFYFIDTNALFLKTGCAVSHKFLSAYTFERAMQKEYLKIGATPLFDQACLELEYVSNEYKGRPYNAFQVKSLSDLDLLEQNTIRILEDARKKEVDILCFPEMLGHPKIINALQDKLSLFPEEGSKEYPALIFCPSYWGQQSNVVTVLDCEGNVICEQAKQYAFPFEMNSNECYLEDIKPDSKIHLIHCEGIGRIGILICKDALNRNYLHAVLEILKVTLLIIPSFSTGHYDFESNLSTCKAHDCSVVWINTCSAYLLSKNNSQGKLGFVLKTGKISHIQNGNYPILKKCKQERCRGCLHTQRLCFPKVSYK